MSRKRNEEEQTTVVTGSIHHETEKAILFLPDGMEDPKEDGIWLPKSQLKNEEEWAEWEKGVSVDLEIPQWLAEAKGL